MAEHTASAVILIGRDGRILLQQRDDDVPPAGYGRWSVPGGWREGEEIPLETARREFAEETGITLERLRFFEVATGEMTATGGRPGLHVFFADDDVPEAAITVNEGLAFRYFTPGEARALPTNPATRTILERFLASDHYHGTVAMMAPFRRGVAVLAMDRWGRVLLQLRDADLPPDRFPDQWSLPGGLLDPGESPDAGTLREFEEETGVLLPDLQLFRVYRRDPDLPTNIVDVQHVYYIDADVPEDLIEVREGQAFRYFAPEDMGSIPIPPHARQILDEFFVSPAYRALFH